MHFRFAGIILASAASPLLAAPSFQGLGDLPGGDYMSRAMGVSADGSVVVGFSGSQYVQLGSHIESFEQGFRWENGTMTGTGYLGPTVQGAYSNAFAISADASTIVGYSYPGLTGNDDAYRLHNGSIQPLGILPGEVANHYEPGAVSADGSIVVGDGYTNNGNGDTGWRWQNGSMTPISGGYLFPDGISADGSVIVGYSGDAAFWKNGSITHLGMLPSDTLEFPTSEAQAVTPDGLTIVGGSTSNRSYDPAIQYGSEAFIWRNGVMTALGDLPGGSMLGVAFAVSADGNTVVGHGSTDAAQEAFIWRPGTEMLRLADVLTGLGLNLDGWVLTDARGLSADGLTIIGTGINPDGNFEGFIAHIPEPSTLVLLVAGIATTRLPRRSQRFSVK